MRRAHFMFQGTFHGAAISFAVWQISLRCFTPQNCNLIIKKSPRISRALL
jgi:hypothetical protein